MENYIYYVGADTALEKKIMEDTVDDVIKCVRSAIKSGVVPGCQLSIIRACSDISAELLGELEIPKDIAKVDKPTKLKLAILEMISNAAQTVYIRVLRGPDNSGILKLIDRWEYMEATEESITALRDAITKKESEILLQSMELNQVFDLESCKYSDNIITSAETDIRVLTAASQLVKLLISGNQCIFMDSEINDSHNENIQVYA
jgi:chaperonin GroEL (HSP60 family)